MFEYFNDIDNNLYKRYQTLLVNIQAESNSFFDSYREVVYEFVYAVYKRENFNYSTNSNLSQLLSDENFEALMSSSNTSSDAIKKIKNLVQNINKHIHKSEKTIDFETYVQYMQVLYDFTSPYAVMNGFDVKQCSLNKLQNLYAQICNEKAANEKAFEILNSHSSKSNTDSPVVKLLNKFYSFNKNPDSCEISLVDLHDLLQMPSTKSYTYINFNNSFDYNHLKLILIAPLLIFSLLCIPFLTITIKNDFSLAWVLLYWIAVYVVLFIKTLLNHKRFLYLDTEDFGFCYLDYIFPIVFTSIKKRSIFSLVLFSFFTLGFYDSYITEPGPMQTATFILIAMDLCIIFFAVYSIYFYKKYTLIDLLVINNQFLINANYRITDNKVQLINKH